MKNIYIHIPFCASNCSYCTFAKCISTNKELHQKYFNMLKKEIESLSSLQKPSLSSLYFGGGTPSLISEDIIIDFFTFLHKKFTLSSSTEITLEVHPSTITPLKIAAWEKVGINRISLGVQSFQKKYDQFLQRNLQSTIKALDLLKKSSFAVSCDLIFGFPDQTETDLLADLTMIQHYDIDHVSYYALDYKPHSKIEEAFDTSLPFEEYCHLYNVLCDFFHSKAYDHYEIFNFSRNGHYSQHNLNFWNQEDYMGFGLSAVSGLGKEVRENTSDLQKYLQGDILESSYILNQDEQLELYLKKALRLKQGVSIADFQSRFPSCINRVIENARTIHSWISFHPQCFFLTEEGKMNFAEIIEVLMSDSPLRS